MAVKARWVTVASKYAASSTAFQLAGTKTPLSTTPQPPSLHPMWIPGENAGKRYIDGTWQIGYVECVRHVRALSPTRNALNKSKLSDYRMRCLPGWRHVCFVYLVKRHCRLHCSAFVEPQANNREKEQERPHQELPARVADGALPLLIVLFANNHSSVGSLVDSVSFVLLP